MVHLTSMINKEKVTYYEINERKRTGEAGAPNQERFSSLLDLYPSTVADGAIFNSVSRQRKQINYYADQSTYVSSMHFR